MLKKKTKKIVIHFESENDCLRVVVVVVFINVGVFSSCSLFQFCFSSSFVCDVYVSIRIDFEAEAKQKYRHLIRPNLNVNYILIYSTKSSNCQISINNTNLDSSNASRLLTEARIYVLYKFNI